MFGCSHVLPLPAAPGPRQYSTDSVHVVFAPSTACTPFTCLGVAERTSMRMPAYNSSYLSVTANRNTIPLFPPSAWRFCTDVKAFSTQSRPKRTKSRKVQRRIYPPNTRLCSPYNNIHALFMQVSVIRTKR